jgi:four helix bundle protein
MDRISNYREWEKGVQVDFTTDPLWRVEVYRLALFLADICWRDVTKLAHDKRTVSLSDQLYRAVGSISANVAEGYSYSSDRNKVRHYEYALGSARESRDWYFKGRYILTEEIVQHRIALLSQISRLLITMISQKRGNTLRESNQFYHLNPQPNEVIPDSLLSNIPTL